QPADPLAVAVFGAFADRLRGARARVGGLRRLLRWTGVRHLVGWEFANRQALLTIAAKCEGIPVSGFMHGAGMRTYMAHEFMPEFQAARPHGPDRFGVWSEWWREYYQRQSKLYGSVEVSGPMRPAAVLAKGERGPREGPLRVLWISEPLIHPSEVIDYLDAVRARHELVIKIRPANKDRFYSALLELRPDYAQTPAVDGSIHEAVANADVVVGSHSTAVIEASLQETPFVLVATQQWGDYFEVADGVQPALYVTTPADLLVSIDAHGTAPDRGRIRQLRERFFGQPGASGTAWLAEVVTADVGAVAT
ncbi:MAG: hypothetical protein HUU35_13430, partial [Armatimonadetes bacterium]|nr:hypothetical protein [Armatimonadota bacterium]